MSEQSLHTRHLAAALTAGPMDDAMVLKARVRPLVGDLRKAKWLDGLVRDLSREFGASPRPVVHLVAARIRRHGAFVKAWSAGRGRVMPQPVEAEMAPAAGAPREWEVPAITTLGGLAEVLGVHDDDLGWITAFGRTPHYLYRWHVKPKSGKHRLIEVPKPLLKLAQCRVLRRILDVIPPHEAAQGFRRGRSIRDFVAPHVGRDLVVRMDLEDFFPSMGAARVLHLFLTAGYPELVARSLVRLVTNAAPPEVLRERSLARPERQRLATGHLPQGAPSSPALANLCAFRLDCRLAGLARAVGAEYTRYADDLLFSGGARFARQGGRFAIAVAAIVIEEGFRPNHRKTRLQRPGQRQEAAGLVLNAKPNVRRREFDRLKAILTNCVRCGPASQNREAHPEFQAHLQGRIAWVRSIHAVRGAKLQEIYDRIAWT